ncbi:MAG TPA: hypothetical protein VE990_10400 [Acidimicrobiales bacterium]|nr:hypothetical protein [Acidimicrobiales bacterium]
MVIETRILRLAEGVERQRFLDADARLQVDFAYSRPGLLRRTTAEGDEGRWLVLSLWRSAQDREAAEAAAAGDEVALSFAALVTVEAVWTWEPRPG